LYHGHTFGGNPLASAAALATLDIFDEERTLEKLIAKVERLGEHVDHLSSHPHVSGTRTRGLLAAMDLVEDKQLDQPYPAQQRRAWHVCRDALSHGVWIRPLGETLYVMPPLAISLEEIDELMGTLAAAIERVID
jgi:adenosylmethionine-8-amino-7-oxononanoate aminotransferase